MVAIHRLLPISSAETLLRIPRALKLHPYAVIFFHKGSDFPAKSAGSVLQRLSHGSPGRRRAPSRVSAGWFSGLGLKKEALPEIVKAGDPVLHEPAGEVPLEDIGSEKIQKIIDDMIRVMRKAPGVGLAAPQIGIPLRIIVLEDTKEYISYAPKDETEAQDRHPFDLLVIINPKLEKKGNKRALFFEGCLSIDGFRAMVERHLQVEVTGYSRFGQPMKIDSSGWMARILQHEYDHLDGTLYVDKIVLRTFRTVENLDLPLPVGCPKPGVSNQSPHLEAKRGRDSKGEVGRLQTTVHNPHVQHCHRHPKHTLGVKLMGRLDQFYLVLWKVMRAMIDYRCLKLVS